MSTARKLMIALTALVGLAPSTDVHAQAYCALRDPVGSIYELFPEAANYRSIVKVVGNDARAAIAANLPLDLHFNELGKHTIYAALKGDLPIGLVHARSESDRWGLTEVVWALDLDLRIVDFRFQRCRNPTRRLLEDSGFRSQLQGKSYPEIRGMLSDDAEHFRAGSYNPSEDIADLALVVIRSALKTILVTATVWENELRSMRVQAMVAQYFGRSHQLEAMPVPYTPELVNELNRHLLEESTGVDRDNLSMHRIRSSDGTVLGFLMDSPWRSGTTEVRLQWALSDSGRVLGVVAHDVDVEPEILNSLVRLRGFFPSKTAQCANALELSAFELSMLARAHSED